MAAKLSLLYSYFNEVQWLLLIQLCQEQSVRCYCTRSWQERTEKNKAKLYKRIESHNWACAKMQIQLFHHAWMCSVSTVQQLSTISWLHLCFVCTGSRASGQKGSFTWADHRHQGGHCQCTNTWRGAAIRECTHQRSPPIRTAKRCYSWQCTEWSQDWWVRPPLCHGRRLNTPYNLLHACHHHTALSKYSCWDQFYKCADFGAAIARDTAWVHSFQQ